MTRRKARIGLALALCLSLLAAPAAVLAQQSKAPSAEKVNLNTATQDQLETLPGIGPAIAKRILEHRTKVGKFGRIEELMNVKGIGEKKFQQIKDRLAV